MKNEESQSISSISHSQPHPRTRSTRNITHLSLHNGPLNPQHLLRPLPRLFHLLPIPITVHIPVDQSRPNALNII